MQCADMKHTRGAGTFFHALGRTRRATLDLLQQNHPGTIRTAAQQLYSSASERHGYSQLSAALLPLSASDADADRELHPQLLACARLLQLRRFGD